jgi:predicted RNase H-like nuclease (RuvC/YqgF family)
VLALVGDVAGIASLVVAFTGALAAYLAYRQGTKGTEALEKSNASVAQVALIDSAQKVQQGVIDTLVKEGVRQDAELQQCHDNCTRLEERIAQQAETIREQRHELTELRVTAKAAAAVVPRLDADIAAKQHQIEQLQEALRGRA